MFNKIYHNTFGQLSGLKLALLVCLISIGVVSCKKGMNDQDSLQSQLASGMVSYVEGSNLVTLNGTNYNFTPTYVGVPVTLSDAAKTADTVTATVDPSLVSQYNQIYKETNASIPEGAFGTSHSGVYPIASGAAQSTDSLYVVLNDGSQLKNGKVYLVPVRLTTKKGSSLKYSIFFFKVQVSIGKLSCYMYGSSIFSSTAASHLTGGALDLVYINAYPDSLKFNVSLNAKFPVHDTYVQATLLTDAEVSAANTTLRYGATTFPAANRTLTKDLVTVPANKLLSRDSLTVKFSRPGLNTFQYYLMGVKLKAYTASPYGIPPVATDSARVYIRVFLFN